MAKADLHSHSVFSDGKLSPTDLIKKAVEKKLSLFALTDHDTIDGVEEAKLEARKHGLEFINGVEITSDFNGKEAHILAYAFNAASEELIQFFLEQKELRINRIRTMVEKLAELGFPLDFDQLLLQSGNGTIGRPHLAKALVDSGYAKHGRDAFIRFIGNRSPAYVKAEHPDYTSVIKIIHRAKGKAILAHPATTYSDTDLNQWIYHGIDGFEMIHPRHPYHLQQKFENLANQYSLLKTGGSDYHGFLSKDDVYFGVVTINTVIVQKLVTLQHQNNS